MAKEGDTKEKEISSLLLKIFSKLSFVVNSAAIPFMIFSFLLLKLS
jgi:hypothetical protein